MNKQLLLILTMSFLVVMAFAVMDKDNNNMPPKKMEQQMCQGDMGQHQNMMETLKLTDDQQKQMQTIMTTHHKDMNTMKAELDNLMIDKRNLIMQQKFDDAKKVVDQIKAKEAVIDKSQIDTHKQMWNLLTDDQKKIAKDKKIGMMEMDGPGPMMMKHKEMKDNKMPPKNMNNNECGTCPMHK
ncbi:MAG TPA: Spy/CpxP family protein refolding chaperone [Candidatus Cloacimonadota bacterium]|nr:Spy/CpxP family protein refolding chaperone [Candidatus Cloacimonadota bacterium]HPT71470.1 Spy/CpxP family protein refolding chaperone [Candidatus Cloacimonadota bacterium]